MQTCLVNLFGLNPPKNGGASRVALAVCKLLAEYFESGKLYPIFAVGWEFAQDFHAWVGNSDLHMIPCRPELGLTPLFQEIKPDIIISPLFGMEPFHDTSYDERVPHIVFMPDALALDKPELFSEDELVDRKKVYNQLQKATSVVTISEFSRSRLIHHLGLDPEKVRIIPLSGDINIHHSELVSDNISTPYILYPANNWPHKRLAFLIKVLDEIIKVRPEIKLILTGRKIPDFESINTIIPEDQIIHLGYVTDAELVALYEQAESLIFVSEYEGFGMPILEAMQAGCPVICAPVTAIPEVAGSAAIFVDSEDPKDWADVFLNELPQQRTKLIDKGYSQAKKYSWSKTRQLWGNYLLEVGLDLSSDKSKLVHFHTGNVYRELQTWAIDYKSLRESSEQKEEIISDLSKLRIELDATIESLGEQVRNYMHSFSYWLILNPIVVRIRVLRTIANKLLGIRNKFTHKLDIKEQYSPIPLLNLKQNGLSPGSLIDDMPTISIVTPSYQQNDFLERAITSVIGQDYPKLEYIIQDGGSSDGSINTIKKHKEKITHFESIPDKGQANAINLGFSHTTGEIMSYINSDDFLLPGSLKFIGNYFIRNPEVDVIYSHRVLVNEKDEEFGRWVLPPHDDNLLIWADYIPQETLYWRRSIWDKAGGFIDESFDFAIDWDLLLRFREVKANFVRVPRFLAAFRVHKDQKTSTQLGLMGNQEMDQLRERYHGREIPWDEVSKETKSYLRKSVIYEKLYRWGLFRF